MYCHLYSRDFIPVPPITITHTVNILCALSHILVLHEEVVSAWDILHDVTLDFVVLQHRQSVVYQDWGRSRLKIRPAGRGGR